jgi:hypothetical protein
MRSRTRHLIGMSVAEAEREFAVYQRPLVRPALMHLLWCLVNPPASAHGAKCSCPLAAAARAAQPNGHPPPMSSVALHAGAS